MNTSYNCSSLPMSISTFTHESSEFNNLEPFYLTGMDLRISVDSFPYSIPTNLHPRKLMALRSSENLPTQVI